MFELIAQGPQPAQRWRKDVPAGGPYVLGRSVEADFPVPWDRGISRQHLSLQVGHESLSIARINGNSNPVFVDGEARESFTVAPGARFAIGETTFTLRVTSRSAAADRTPVEQAVFDSQTLRAVRFDDADRRIEVLTRLPDVILGTSSTEEIHQRVVDLVLTGVPRAEAAAIVTGRQPHEVSILYQDRRHPLEGRLQPSGRLVAECLRSGRSILHVWDATAAESPFTVAAESDWAFCTPLEVTDSQATGLYVAGRREMSVAALQNQQRIRSADALQADVKFAELVAEILNSVLRLKTLERQTAGLKQFLAPPILAALGEKFDSKLLEPRECIATVLFCDLRGFSAKAEKASGDLVGLLERVSQALGVMTREILAHNGVTGDFLGDAALGFWGWPISSDEAPLDACRAALAIRKAFADAAADSDHPLRDFRVGIGIAHGPAVAGKIGTVEQVKFTVFGPIVNLASRLEGMSKQLRVPILIDEATSAIVRDRLSKSVGRVRNLARVLPYGSERPLVVSELLPSASDLPELSDEDLATYEAAFEAFSAGRWDEAYRLLHRLPAEDRAPDFLNQIITSQNRVAPPGWDGIVKMPSK